MFNIHENAKSNFDDKGNELLTRVEEMPPEQPRAKLSPDIRINCHLTDKDIISFHPSTLVNGFGEEHGFYFTHDGKKYGIFGEKYKDLLKLAESITKIPIIKDKISQKTIKELIFEWINNRSNRSITDGLTEYIMREATNKVVLQEVWLPIRFLIIEMPFTVGRIIFKPITKAMINGLEAKCINDSPDNEDKIKTMFDKDIRDFQGYAAATLIIEADPSRAEEVALEETQKSLLILRMFSAAALHPKITSRYNIWGSEKVDRASILFIKDEKLTSFSEQLLQKGQTLENMAREFIEMNMDAGLKILSDLLTTASKTPFQKIALDSFFIFARCTTAKDPADKLVYVLVALESLFLRNNTEPIQQNLAERLAFLIENNIEGRREVIRDVKNAYSIRSSFVHHGASIDDYEALEKFMWHAWRAITVIISATKSFKTKEELLDHLDERKLT